MEPRARVSVWPGRHRVPGIVAPDSWGARGAECLPRDVLRRSSPATSPCDGTTARRCLCLRTGFGTTEARPPASSVPPAPHGGLGGCRADPANSGPDFRSSSDRLLSTRSADCSPAAACQARCQRSARSLSENSICALKLDRMDKVYGRKTLAIPPILSIQMLFSDRLLDERN